MPPQASVVSMTRRSSGLQSGQGQSPSGKIARQVRPADQRFRPMRANTVQPFLFTMSLEPTPSFTIQQLSATDDVLMNALLDVFGEAFEDAETYSAHRPRPAYLRQLLASDAFIALVAVEGSQVVGGLAAYELKKFEQERSEIYIYDLAVATGQRRRGVATGLIRELQRIGGERGAYVLFVQADLPDEPAIALYAGLGVREDVLHFDLPVRAR